MIAHVRSIHERVRGKDERGRPYLASDPHLLRWVHLAEIDSFLRALSDVRCPSRSRPATPTATSSRPASPRPCSASLDPPRSVSELRQALGDYRSELETTTAARDAARFLLLNPPLPYVARPGYGTIASGGVSLLPPWALADARHPVARAR